MGIVRVVVPAGEDATERTLARPAPLTRLRSQAAIIRSLADQVDFLSSPGDMRGLREQLIEELARLGCLLLEEASSMAAGAVTPESSGVFERSRLQAATAEGDASVQDFA